MNCWLIAYDITHGRRLQRVYRHLCGYASPIEYSIFLLSGSQADLDRCMAELGKLIDARKDDLRCYPLPARGLQLRIGKATLPDGIQWTGLPASFLPGQG